MFKEFKAYLMKSFSEFHLLFPFKSYKFETKYKTMRKLWILLAIAVIGKVSAQDLIVEYDFISDSYKFYQNNRPIPQPVIKKNYEVKVQVKNLNPFVFIARCGWRQQVAENNSSTSSIAAMFKGVGGLGSISSILTGLNMDQFEDKSVTRGGASLLENNFAAKASLQSTINAYNKLFEIEQILNKVEYSTAKLQKLKLNPYLNADTLKFIAHELTTASLSTPTNKVKNLNATGFIQYSTNLSNDMAAQYDNLVENTKVFITEYNNFLTRNGTNFAEVGMDKTINGMINSANLLKAKYNSDLINAKMDALEQQYETITYTPFTYSCNYMATGDLLSLTLDFFQITQPNNAPVFNSVNITDTMRKVRTKSMNILIRGDMKISTSVGLGFPTYFNKNQTYSNRDSMIYGVSGNNYAPCISTYINFYPYSGRNIHWGGTFGVGIPVQNEGTSALNFFLGGSAVLGSSSKVVIHGGLAIGQLNLLSAGQKTGDNLGDKITTPVTKKSFVPGAFFGISFALSK